MLRQGELADLAVEDLRKWGRWETADKVLALYGKPSHNIPIVRRTILRYALSCPKKTAADLAVAMARNRIRYRGEARCALRYLPAMRVVVDAYRRLVRDDYPELAV